MNKKFNLTAEKARQAAELTLKNTEVSKVKITEYFIELILEGLSNHINHSSQSGEFKVGVSAPYYYLKNQAKDKFNTSGIYEEDFENIFNNTVEQVKDILENKGFKVDIEFSELSFSGMNETYETKFNISW